MEWLYIIVGVLFVVFCVWGLDRLTQAMKDFYK